MKDGINNALYQSAKHWWLSLIVGILAIAIGILSSVKPIATIGILTFFFIASFLISGIFDIFYAFLNRKSGNRWGWLLVGGIVNFIFVIILIALPIANMGIFIYYVAFYIMLQSFMGLWASYSLKQSGYQNWWMFFIIALLGLILSLIMVFEISFAVAFITIVFSVSFICYGLFRVSFAFRLKKLKNAFEKQNIVE